MVKKYYHATNYTNFSGIMAEDVIKAGIDGVCTFVILQKMLVSSWLFEERRGYMFLKWKSIKLKWLKVLTMMRVTLVVRHIFI